MGVGVARSTVPGRGTCYTVCLASASVSPVTRNTRARSPGRRLPRALSRGDHPRADPPRHRSVIRARASSTTEAETTTPPHAHGRHELRTAGARAGSPPAAADLAIHRGHATRRCFPTAAPGRRGVGHAGGAEFCRWCVFQALVAGRMDGPADPPPRWFVRGLPSEGLPTDRVRGPPDCPRYSGRPREERSPSDTNDFSIKIFSPLPSRAPETGESAPSRGPGEGDSDDFQICPDAGA